VRNGSLAGYAQADYKLTHWLTLSAGLRHTEDTRGVTYRDRNEFPSAPTQCEIQPALLNQPGVCSAKMPDLKFGKTNYSFSATAALNDDVNIYATARSGYRSGGYVIFDSILNGVSTFKPDSVNDVEVGVKSEWFDRHMRANLALYNSDYTDIQKATNTVLPDGISEKVIANAASATIRGAEFELTARPTAHIDIDANAAYTDAHYNKFLEFGPGGVVTNNRTSEPFEVPKWTFGPGIDYHTPLAVGELDARLDWYWRSSVIFTGSNALLPTEQILRQSGYGLLSGRVEWKVTPDTSIAIVGRNLLNKTYLVGGIDLSSVGFKVGMPGEPRYVGVQLTKHWGGG